MHDLQPTHQTLNEKEIEKLLNKLNISLAQLPKIAHTDPALPKETKKGDVLKIERKGETVETYYRVAV